MDTALVISVITALGGIVGGISGIIMAGRWAGKIETRLDDQNTLLTNHVEHITQDITAIREDVRQINLQINK
jgi:hypothetical protein